MGEGPGEVRIHGVMDGLYPLHCISKWRQDDQEESKVILYPLQIQSKLALQETLSPKEKETTALGRAC